MRAAASRTFCTAGKSSPIKIAMIAITTSNSMSVKPDRFVMIVILKKKIRNVYQELMLKHVNKPVKPKANF
jgi:hypothetical protein